MSRTNNRGWPTHGGRFRGRGRGNNGNRGRGRGRGRGRAIGVGFEDAFDFSIQIWSELDSYTPNPRGRGRSRPNSGYASPLGRAETPRGRGRGRGEPGDQLHSPRPRSGPGGRGSGAIRKYGPLSNLLYAERPFLKPIVFVPSVHTPKLFENEADEDLFRPQVEEISDNAKDHVPTADHVFRVFSGGQVPSRPADSDSGSDKEKEELEEIDFEDMGRIRKELEAISQVDLGGNSKATEVEEKFTAAFCSPAAQEAAGSHVTRGDVEEATVDIRPLSSPSPPNFDPESPTLVELDETTTEPSEFYIDINSDTNVASTFQPALDAMAAPVGFYVDNTADRNLAGSSKLATATTPALGEDDDDEVIVYVAPHPRVSKPSPPLELADFPPQPTTSMLTGTTSTFTPNPATEPETPSHSLTVVSVSPSFTKSPTLNRKARTRPVFIVGNHSKSKSKARKKDARVARRRLERKAMFGSFGAIMSEAQLRGGEKLGKGKDPRWEERRRGDSDVDWGEEEKVEGEDDSVVDVSNGVGAMDLDSNIDLDAMKAFVNGMSANGGRHVTMDDIADEERMRQEDEDDDPSSDSLDSDSYHNAEEEESGRVEEEAVMFKEEELIIGEPVDLRASDDDDSDSDSDDDIDIDQSPNTGFQARLQRLRKNSLGKTIVDARQFEDGTSDDDFFDGIVRGDEDDDFIAHIESLLDDHSGIISAADRKARNRLFRAVQNGDFSDLEDDFVPAHRKRDKHLPEHLRDQWNKDRAKKAEYKKARAHARLEAAADPLTVKKGGKKGRKAMLAAAKFNPTIEIPHRVVDMITIEQQIRRFVRDIGSGTTMSLPPMEKQSREQVHELAHAFNLKSQSKGKGEARYTTLTKTSRSGIMIDERKIRRITKRSGTFMGPIEGGGKGKGKSTMPMHRDGDEVGKAAAKIGEANIGYKMLASMGWAEGDRIGNSGGLNAPLTAVIKNTKLGLGATR